MPDSEQKEKRVHFFGLVVQERSSAVRAEQQSWASLLEAKSQLSIAERTFEGPYGIQLVTEHIPGSQQVVLGRVVDDTGLRLAHMVTGKFRPVVPESADEFFTRVTYLQFFDSCNAVALVGGAGTVPSKSHLEALVNWLAPLEGARWAARDLWAQGDIERFNGSSGASKVEISTDAHPADLVSLDEPEAQSIGGLVTRAASLTGADISVSMTIRVRRPRDHPEATRILKGLVSRTVPFRGARKVRVETTGLASEVLNLVQYKLAAQVALPLDHVTPAELQEAILDALAHVCGQWETRVRKAMLEDA